MAERTRLQRPRGYDPEPFDIPPLYRAPFRPLAGLRWFVTKFMWPQSLAWIGIAFVAYRWFTPSLDRTRSFGLDWVALIYLRNVAIMVIVIGGLHLRLHIRRAQDDRYKYEARWLATNRSTFMFSHQTRDNMFRTLVSGGIVVTVYEASMLWLYANERIPHIGWSQAPAYVVMITLAVFFIESVHFYVNHRLLHWDPLYDLAHSVHHKNVNTGPWSGIAMHPVEHVLYFSLPLVFLVIPGNPFIAVFCGIYLMLSPAPSHSGFDRFEVGPTNLHGGDYFHNLHHRYFECNYGVLLLPIDKWVGTFHDGSQEAHELMKYRRRHTA